MLPLRPLCAFHMPLINELLVIDGNITRTLFQSWVAHQIAVIVRDVRVVAILVFFVRLVTGKTILDDIVQNIKMFTFCHQSPTELECLCQCSRISSGEVDRVKGAIIAELAERFTAPSSIRSSLAR